ncbi:helix-turn-helix domain-containing protein [Caldifermentibacillus hisashii]|uniref:helix-turn-helix domain-containing protein n=1 Tax=Caldifermentibacillus hisashii TaxID=996558 RepID=UPI0034D66429
MKDLSYKFGKRLQKIRKEKGLTQLELAEMIDVSSDFIGLMERGVNSPSFKTLEKLSETLKIPVYKFFQFDDE